MFLSTKWTLAALGAAGLVLAAVSCIPHDETPVVALEPGTEVAPMSTQTRALSKLPPIDREVPAKLETATFALG